MKRYISVLILFFYLLFCVPVFAANGSVYELPELGCSVTIPSDYSVMLRDEPVPDTILDRLGKTREAVHDLFEQGIYLDAIPNDDLDDELLFHPHQLTKMILILSVIMN